MYNELKSHLKYTRCSKLKKKNAHSYKVNPDCIKYTNG